MRFHSDAFCAGAHWRILFKETDVYGFDGREVVENVCSDALADVFQEFGRDGHFFFHYLKNIGITDSAFQFVGFSGMGEIRFQFQVYIVICTYKVLLWEHSVVCMDFQAFQADVHMGGFHDFKKNVILNEVKNLVVITRCFQILRYAQNDISILND